MQAPIRGTRGPEVRAWGAEIASVGFSLIALDRSAVVSPSSAIGGKGNREVADVERSAMTSAQALLLAGGLASLAFATLSSFALYWIRLRDVLIPPPRYALITHTSATTSGLVLIALSVVIVHSGFTESINLLLAGSEILAVALTTARNVVSWRARIEDGMADIPEQARRIRGLVNVISFVVMSALLYGVIRTGLGI